MDQAINNLLNIIVNINIIGGCGDVCSLLPNQYEQVICDLLCDYVGIEEFINAINYEDPDPIYICQYLNFCPVVHGGKVNITYANVSPKKGESGSSFSLSMKYKVIKPTSTGSYNVLVVPSDGFPVGGGQFTEGQAVGEYSASWTLRTQQTEYDPWGPGLVKVIFYVCSGDCTNSHPWGGVYAEAKTQFEITS